MNVYGQNMQQMIPEKNGKLWTASHFLTEKLAVSSSDTFMISNKTRNKGEHIWNALKINNETSVQRNNSGSTMCAPLIQPSFGGEQFFCSYTQPKLLLYKFTAHNTKVCRNVQPEKAIASTFLKVCTFQTRISHKLSVRKFKCLKWTGLVSFLVKKK